VVRSEYKYLAVFLLLLSFLLGIVVLRPIT